MKLMIDISKDKYDEIMSMDWKNCRHIFDEEIRAIHDGTPLEECNDAISRQAAIDAFERFIHELGIKDEPYNYGEMTLSLQNVLPVTPAEKVGKWIPVSERYPTDANKSYLVCYEDGCITIEHLYFDGDGYPFFSEMELGVVAWMPLPEPFEGNTK